MRSKRSGKIIIIIDKKNNVLFLFFGLNHDVVTVVVIWKRNFVITMYSERSEWCNWKNYLNQSLWRRESSRAQYLAEVSISHSSNTRGQPVPSYDVKTFTSKYRNFKKALA